MFIISRKTTSFPGKTEQYTGRPEYVLFAKQNKTERVKC